MEGDRGEEIKLWLIMHKMILWALYGLLPGKYNINNECKTRCEPVAWL